MRTSFVHDCGGPPKREAAIELVGRSTKGIFLFCTLALLLAACSLRVGLCDTPPTADEGETGAAADEGALPGDYEKEFAGEGESLGSTTTYILRVAVDLAIVVALVWLVVWALKRFSHKGRILGFLSRWRLGGESKSMRLLETMSLGPARSLHLVEVGGKILVVGSTSANVSFIVEIQDPGAVEAIVTKSGESSEFAEALRSDLADYESKGATLTESNDAPTRLRQLARAVAAKAKGLGRHDAD